MSKRQRSSDDDHLPMCDNKKAKKLPKLFNSEFFKVKSWDGTSTKIIAECTICKNNVKGDFTSTGNFFKHYK